MRRAGRTSASRRRTDTSHSIVRAHRQHGRAGLVDELVVYMAPVLMGSAARPLLDLRFAAMDEKLGLQITDVTAVGSDWRITASVGGV